MKTHKKSKHVNLQCDFQIMKNGQLEFRRILPLYYSVYYAVGTLATRSPSTYTHLQLEHPLHPLATRTPVFTSLTLWMVTH